MALLELKDVSFSSRELEIVKNINVQIESGTTSAFLGKSGSGKSTALKLLAGIINPTHGKLLFEGKDVSTMNSTQNEVFRKRAAFMFQDSALWANQDIYHNLELPLQIHFPKMTQSERKLKIQAYANLVGYDRPLTNRPASLSTGEQKKIGFARALICDPEILFMDECTESLDEKGIQLFVSILKDFCYNKNTLIYVSHDAEFIKAFGGNKYIFQDGVLTRTVIQEVQEN